MTKKIIIAIFAAMAFGLCLIFIKHSMPEIFKTIVIILNVVGAIFIRLLKFTIVPIIIFSLINGIINLENVAELKKLGLKTMGFFILTTSIALILSISISNLLNAGAAFSSEEFTAIARKVTSGETPSLIDSVIGMVPDNIITPMSSANMPQVIFIAIIFAVAILNVVKKDREMLTVAVSRLEQVVIGVITMIMRITPYGVFALLSKSIATQGFEILAAMVQYAVIMGLILGVHFCVVYIPLIRLSGMKLFTFLKKTAPASAIAFSTTSSAATLPVSIKLAEEKLGIPKTYSSFILPLGATVHMNGTAIMQGLAVVFLSNIYGIELSVLQYIGAGLLAMVATVGAAGIPGTGLITLTMILVQYGIPVEGIGIIIAIDRLMEMLRTLLNVMGDIIVATLVAKSDGNFDIAFANSEDVKEKIL